MVLRASWTAMCMIAYMRDSWKGLLSGARQAAVAALPAFWFQVRTASPAAADAIGTCGCAGEGRRVKATAARTTRRNVGMCLRITHLFPRVLLPRQSVALDRPADQREQGGTSGSHAAWFLTPPVPTAGCGLTLLGRDRTAKHDDAI